MPNYKTKKIPLSRILLTTKGCADPMCNYCHTRDCTNPIEEKSVSVLGVLKKQKFYMMGEDPFVVLDCEGFVNFRGEENPTQS